eukprot:COSAG05_NODE_822_length_7122_cov_18.423893_2_plen_131_part_00
MQLDYIFGNEEACRAATAGRVRWLPSMRRHGRQFDHALVELELEIQSQVAVDKNIAITEVCRDLLERARAQSEIHFIKVKGHLHEELAKVGVTDEDLAPGETYKDLGNVRADELATRAMWSGEHSGYSFR